MNIHLFWNSCRMFGSHGINEKRRKGLKENILRIKRNNWLMIMLNVDDIPNGPNDFNECSKVAWLIKQRRRRNTKILIRGKCKEGLVSLRLFPLLRDHDPGWNFNKPTPVDFPMLDHWKLVHEKENSPCSLPFSYPRENIPSPVAQIETQSLF